MVPEGHEMEAGGGTTGIGEEIWLAPRRVARSEAT
jgi:hypothetical protein